MPAVAEIKYDPSNQDKFFRFAAEEVCRRALKRDAEKLSVSQIFSLLYGEGLPLLKEKIKHRRIEEERKKGQGKDGGSAYSKYEERANIFRAAHEKAAAAKKASADQTEEVKVEEHTTATGGEETAKP